MMEEQKAEAERRAAEDAERERIRTEKRAAKEKRREEAKMREGERKKRFSDSMSEVRHEMEKPVHTTPGAFGNKGGKYANGNTKGQGIAKISTNPGPG